MGDSRVAGMKKKCMAVVVIMVVSLLLTTACSLDENEQDNIAALVNGEPIILDDLHTWIDQWEIGLEVQMRL